MLLLITVSSTSSYQEVLLVQCLSWIAQQLECVAMCHNLPRQDGMSPSPVQSPRNMEGNCVCCCSIQSQAGWLVAGEHKSSNRSCETPFPHPILYCSCAYKGFTIPSQSCSYMQEQSLLYNTHVSLMTLNTIQKATCSCGRSTDLN